MDDKKHEAVYFGGDEAGSKARHPTARHTLAHLEDNDLDLAMHAIEAEHLAHQQPTTVGTGIARTARDRMYDPIRDTAMALEYFGGNYREIEDILRRHLDAAIGEITRSTD